MGIPDAASLEVTATDVFLMGRGEWFKAQEKLGAHLAYRNDAATGDRVMGCFFAVWAPGVAAVHVTGGFCDWDPEAHALVCTETGGIWQGFVDGVYEGISYKYVIDTADGERLFKADPYAFRSEQQPETASIVASLDGFPWMDGDWLAERSRTDHFKRPLNIYEVHLGSWMRHDDGLSGMGREPKGEQDAGGSYLSYEELAKTLVPYVRDMGYTHVELLPVMEHPFDGSWGYQTTAYFAPTSRFGEPKGFMHLVDAFHRAGIGVILDRVPGGFCRDAHGLSSFNGSMLYEHEEHPEWGTLKFDFGRGEVRSFLISNALFWLETYHADGLRVDGVTSILYLNFALPDGAPRRTNRLGGEEDLEAVAFLRSLNTTISAYHPDVMCIAEESTAWPLVTYPPAEGGLGFHYKWDLGWMNDTLRYMQTDFPFRPGVHGLLTFSM
ncbi:MAG: 1,4-alpha-glucan branching enzyme, partial [Atopobiaceae bacterium]|nr:1,4-alpha-glucan branching enzyme [Atopobiaceae bacterium]